jgi:subtilisin family serine protease
MPHEEGVYEPPINDHGTHVAGILAADWREEDAAGEERVAMQGVCPDLRLYDLRVLDARGRGDEFAVLAALQFVHHLNGQKEFLAVHGVNLSLSLRHEVANYACGRTPVCDECERLVATGVVVVAAAGNVGYLKYHTADGVIEAYQTASITDPGNAEEVITVGATHRYEPHTYGVSYFSSRGPTGDGRRKPDLVAPGEKITAPTPGEGSTRKDGTSMAAPHVSGAAAALMARHKELVGRPRRIKQILCDTATDLGRERYFQGAGMVDVLRALQSV